MNELNKKIGELKGFKTGKLSYLTNIDWQNDMNEAWELLLEMAISHYWQLQNLSNIVFLSITNFYTGNIISETGKTAQEAICKVYIIFKEGYGKEPKNSATR